MDAWMLVFTILAFVAALAAAVFGYPAWRDSRRRPDLRLEFERMRGSGYWYLRIRNAGKRSAIGWALTIVSPHRFIPTTRDVPFQRNEETDTGWIQLWHTTGADDTIEPDISREALVGLGGFTDEVVLGKYTLPARGMKRPRTGEIRRGPPGSPDWAQADDGTIIDVV